MMFSPATEVAGPIGPADGAASRVAAEAANPGALVKLRYRVPPQSQFYDHMKERVILLQTHTTHQGVFVDKNASTSSATRSDLTVTKRTASGI